MTKPDTKKKSEADPEPELADVTESLSEQQWVAVDLLTQGMTVTACAEKVGVTRQTVSGWVNHHDVFRLALEIRRTERGRAIHMQLQDATLKAIAVLVKELEGDNKIKAASLLLRHAGVSNNPAPLDEQDLIDLNVYRQENPQLNLSGLRSLWAAPLPVKKNR